MTVEVKPIWLERAAYSISLLAFITTVVIDEIRLMKSRVDVTQLQAEVDMARDAQGRTARAYHQCDRELVEKNGQLQVVDRWLQLAAGRGTYVD